MLVQTPLGLEERMERWPFKSHSRWASSWLKLSIVKISQNLALLLGVLTASFGLGSRDSHAFVSSVWNYLKQYQFGVDYASTNDSMAVTYDVEGANRSACSSAVDRPGYSTCNVEIRRSTPSSGTGFVLQQAFRRQGNFYFKPDLSLGVRYLTGELTKNEGQKQVSLGLPLKSLSYSLAALVVKPYIQIGITPKSRWPDLLLSLGPAMQVALGQVGVNDEKQYVAMATTSDSYFFGFFEVEIVLVRFGDGAFSLFTSTDNTHGGKGTRFYPKTVDGMDRFYATSKRSIGGGFWGYGLKLILNWP